LPIVTSILDEVVESPGLKYFGELSYVGSIPPYPVRLVI
jgi:hypothetical protein